MAEPGDEKAATKGKRRWRQFSIANILIVLLSVALSAATCLADGSGGPLRLTLPAQVYAVPGVETSVYHDNIVLTETPEAYRFQVTCDIGTAEKRRWTLTAKPADVGDHPLTVTVCDDGGAELGRAATTLKVIPANAGAGRSIRLWIVGDSLTHATTYSNEIARLLSLPGSPNWKLLGTHRPPSAAEGVAHEGYGGWTWRAFASRYEPNPDGTYRKRSSPFVYVGPDGKPSLDLKRYFDENCGGEPPDFITFLLGINDCFSADPSARARQKGAAPTTFAIASAPGNAGRGPMRRRRRKGLAEAVFQVFGNPDYHTGYENIRFSRMSLKTFTKLSRRKSVNLLLARVLRLKVESGGLRVEKSGDTLAPQPSTLSLWLRPGPR